MRIVHAVRSDSFSGVERYLTYVAPEQAARGHEVLVIGGDPAFMADAFDRAGVRHRPATTTADVVRALVDERAFRPDIVHSHMTAADTASLATRPLVRGTRISTLHFAKPRGRTPALQAAWRIADRGLSAQVAISEYVAASAEVRSTVIWNGIPDLSDEERGRRATRTRLPVVLAAQRFDDEKDTSLALRAWADSRGAELGWELHLAGRGQERRVLEALVTELGIGDSVRFLGMVDDLPEHMELASIFLASAPGEAFGLSVVEAMRSELPIVATDGGAHAEVLGRTNVPEVSLVPIGEVGPLRDALNLLMQDAELRAEVGAANVDRFRAEFTCERHVDQLDDLYEARLGRSARRRRGGPVEVEHASGSTRVVFVDHCARLSGGEIALVRLIEGFHGVRAHVVLGEHGPLEASLRGAGASVEVQEIDPDLANTRRDEVGVSLGLHRLTSTVRTVWQLRGRLRQLRPDAVHTNSLKAAIYGGVAGRLAGIPVVWHIRDRVADDYLPGPVVRAVRLLARVIPSAVICNSEETRSTLGLPAVGGRRPVTVVHDPVPELPAVTTDRGPDSVPFRVAMVGRLSAWKGQDVFLRSMAQAFPDGEAEAVLVGSAMFGEDVWEAELHRLVHDLGLDGRVRFTGFVDDVPAALADVDVLVHASVIPEPFGQVVVEGMAMGLPVVASAAGGPLEIITDDVDGLLSPPGDVAALAGCLSRLQAEPELRRRLGAAGRARVAPLTPASVARVVAGVYDQVR